MISYYGMLCLVASTITMGHARPPYEEGACYSMFNYEYKVIQKLVELTNSQDKLSQEIQTQQKKMEGQITEADERHGKMVEQITALESIRKVQQVAFTAHTPSGTLVARTPTFQHVILNEGGAYNTSTGRFTCPIQGIYLFTMTLLRGSSTSGTVRVYCVVYQNTTQVAEVYSYNGVHDSASINVFLHLFLGDDVHLSCYNWQLIHKAHHTLYSGALVSAD